VGWRADWREEKKEKEGVKVGGEETGDKPESSSHDFWWVITPASGREYPPVGTEAYVVRAIH